MLKNTREITILVDFSKPENKEALNEIYLFLLTNPKATLKKITGAVPQLEHANVVKVFVLELWRRRLISPLKANASQYGRQPRRWVTGESGIPFDSQTNERVY